ncbi:hypothetical protein WJX72_002843 [[Myrmecia] bisecta]|uniref:F-box domain-containing protein n=1 Tax=[Myrmecia] bisecta TaxID=41462 RepID=A0AAW1PFW3_9CHLO
MLPALSNLESLIITVRIDDYHRNTIGLGTGLFCLSELTNLRVLSLGADPETPEDDDKEDPDVAIHGALGLASIWDLTRLTKLHLSSHGIKHISTDISRLQQLKDLEVVACGWTDGCQMRLPSGLGTLSQLDTLSLRRTYFNHDDEDLCLTRLTSLRKLDLHGSVHPITSKVQPPGPGAALPVSMAIYNMAGPGSISEASAELPTIPTDVLADIFSRLPVSDRLAAQLVCKQWGPSDPVPEWQLVRTGTLRRMFALLSSSLRELNLGCCNDLWWHEDAVLCMLPALSNLQSLVITVYTKRWQTVGLGTGLLGLSSLTSLPKLSVGADPETKEDYEEDVVTDAIHGVDCLAGIWGLTRLTSLHLQSHSIEHIPDDLSRRAGLGPAGHAAG